tara:strand:- start:447 stop:908 length:462 start_codon:yes stop_codon:yes gene_type:complete
VEPFVLLAGILAACVAGISLGFWRRSLAAFVLLGNWAANTAVVSVTGNDHPWVVFATIDYVSALAFLMIGGIAGRLVAATYALQLLMHAAYVISGGGPWPDYAYWWGLYYVAWAQVAIVFGWMGIELARRAYARRGSISAAAPSHHPQRRDEA